MRLAKWKNLSQTPLCHSELVVKGSVVWKGILQAAPLLSSGLCLQPRNGRNILLQEDPWLSGGVLCKPGWRDGVMLSPNTRFISDLVLPGGDSWNEALIFQLFTNNSVAKIIQLVPRPDAVDRWIWTKELNGIFSVKSLVVAEQNRRAPSGILVASFPWNLL